MAIDGVSALWLDMIVHRTKKYQRRPTRTATHLCCDRLYLDKVKDDRVAMTELAVCRPSLLTASSQTYFQAADIPGTTVTILMANMSDTGWTSEYFHVRTPRPKCSSG